MSNFHETTLLAIANYVILSSFVPLVVFIIIYSSRPWRTSGIGIGYMVQKFSMAVLMLFILASVILPDFPGREWIRLVVYVAVVATFWFDVVQVTHVQKRANKLKR